MIEWDKRVSAWLYELFMRTHLGGRSMKNRVLALLIALGLGVAFVCAAAVAGTRDDQQFMPDTETSGGV